MGQLELKAQIESIRTDFEEKLQCSEEQLKEVKLDKERLIRYMKASLEDIESERDSLRTTLAENVAVVIPVKEDSYKEEKKESEDNIPVSSPDNQARKESEDVVSSSETQRLMELEKDLKNFEQLRGRLAEKASKQAITIATLQEENEMKDEQLKSLNEMIEMLLGKKGKVEDNNRPWGQRISKLRDISQRKASDFLNLSRHGSMHGSRHGSMHGSRHGSMHGSLHGSMH